MKSDFCLFEIREIGLIVYLASIVNGSNWEWYFLSVVQTFFGDGDEKLVTLLLSEIVQSLSGR